MARASKALKLPALDRNRLVNWVESRINVWEESGEQAGVAAEEIVRVIEAFIGNKQINERKD